MQLLKQELVTLPKNLSSHPLFSDVLVAQTFVFCVDFCKSLSICLSFFCWPLYCLSFFDLPLLINPLLSSNLSFNDMIQFVTWMSPQGFEL